MAHPAATNDEQGRGISDNQDDSDNEHGDEDQTTLPRYPGEDCRLTSPKELFGFYAYQCAIEVVAIAGVGSFLPIALEDLARANGVLQSDRGTPCTAAASGSSHDLSGAPSSHQGDQCIVLVFGVELNTASFAMFTFAASVLLQAIVVITMSGAADHGRYRKSLLLVFAAVGAMSLMFFLPLSSSVFVSGAVLAVVANVCLGASTVLLNSYLPLLVRWHPLVKCHQRHRSTLRHESIPVSPTDSEFDHSTIVEDSPFLPIVATPQSPVDVDADADSASEWSRSRDETNVPVELQVSTQISARGYGTGYVAALFFQFGCLGILLAAGSTSFSLRLVLFAIGAWWLAISLPVAYCMRPRPGPPLLRPRESASSRLRALVGYTTYSWRQLGKTMTRATQSRDLLLFLTAWFLISDAIATVSGTAILFAKTTLGMSTAELSLISVTTTIFGIAGAFSCNRVARLLGWTPTRVLVACICLFETIPLYGLLPYIPAIERLGVIGLQRPWETYLLGAVYGIVLGCVGSLSRSLFGELVPPGSEAAFYALYAVTDKGSSMFGPTIIGIITDATGEIRPGFLFLAVLVALPLWPLAYVDLGRGKRQAVEIAKMSAPVSQEHAGE